MLGTFLDSEEREEDVDTLGGLLYTQLDGSHRAVRSLPPFGLPVPHSGRRCRRIRTVLISAAQQRPKPANSVTPRKHRLRHERLSPPRLAYPIILALGLVSALAFAPLFWLPLFWFAFGADFC